MKRRALLKLVAAAAFTRAGRLGAVPKDIKIVVAGAGIIGASIAYHLAKPGASVTVIDKQGPASHASRGTFAWINATWAKQPRHYHSLTQDSVAYWKDLQQTLALPVRGINPGQASILTGINPGQASILDRRQFGRNSGRQDVGALKNRMNLVNLSPVSDLMFGI